MQREPEPELMDDAAQAAAYAHADFDEAHSRFIQLFREAFPGADVSGTVLDLGCGPADISLRFAHAYPRCVVHGVDGAQAMLAHGRARLQQEGFERRVRLIHGYLPGASLALNVYDAVISNSLLHHLRDPLVLWRTINQYAKTDAPIFVMDLLRPASRAAAQALVDAYAADEPAILRHDFLHSLLAAYRPDEVAVQLHAAGLDGLQIKQVSDCHLLVYGRAA